MVSFRESKNYIWFTDNTLGAGATAVVYTGYNKHTGEPVAVKVFFKEHVPGEIRILKQIDHKNIVKLLDIEETSNGHKVLIMELCTGNSLSKILNDPENDYGLGDIEFLLVLKNLYDGVKYLRQHNFIHRDLKPDNIMRCVLEDGSHIYKITDFGAARELEEGEQFLSIHGTEEYLHPNMYERAFLTRRERPFDGTVDLWSLGVTLYHAATGTLPFKPYGGRRNRDKTAMYKITSKKESGFISGKQSQPNGRVIYSKELPKGCLMSDNLKGVITPLLAGLMEADISKTWNFNRFFDEVEKIISRKIVHLFYMNFVDLFTLYVLADETCEGFQKIIMESTGLAIENQWVLHQNAVLDMRDFSKIPNTTEESPLFLFDKTSGVTCSDKSIPSVNNLGSQHSLDEDAAHCRHICKVGYQYKRDINKYSLHSKLIDTGIETLVKYLDSQFSCLKTEAKHAKDIASSLLIAAKFAGMKQLENDFNVFVSDTFDRINLLPNSIQEASLKIDWKNLNENISEIPSLKAKAAKYVEGLTRSLNQLEKDKGQGVLSQIGQNFHNMEKAKVDTLMLKLKDLLIKALNVNSQITQSFSSWYPTILSVNDEIEALRIEVIKFKEQITKLEKELSLAAQSKKPFGRSYENLTNMLATCKNKDSCDGLIAESHTLFEHLSRQQHEIENLLLDYKKFCDNISLNGL